MHSFFKKGKALMFHLSSFLLLGYMLFSVYNVLPSTRSDTFITAQTTETDVDMLSLVQQTEAAAPAASDQEADADELRQTRHVVTVSSSSLPDSIQIVGPSDVQLSKMKSVEVVATGYTAGYESTGKTPDHPEYGITYSGIEVRRDHLSTIAADLNLFPLGTILWIPDYGYGIVSDIGGAIKGNKIDLYFETEEEVYRYWGKKTVNVYIVEEGSGKLTEAMFGEKSEAFAG